MTVQIETKTVVSVAEMARMVGLSRARFYQLQRAGAFPMPVYDTATRRPIYTEEQQQTCLDVRRRNCGIDGKAVLFYARRFSSVAMKSRVRPTKVAMKGDVSALVDGLTSLGLTTATAAQVEQITKELFPHGTAGTAQGEVLRAVFLHIRGQYSSDNVR